MSRTVISAVVGVVIAALTAIAFFVSSHNYDSKIRNRADAQANRSYQLVQRLYRLWGSELTTQAERLASKTELATSIDSGSETERVSQARKAFQMFIAEEKARANKPDIVARHDGKVEPDIIALLNAKGDLVAMHDVPQVTASDWRNETKGETNPTKVPTIVPAVNIVLKHRMIVSDLWVHKGGLMQIGVAPVIDYAQIDAANPSGKLVGAVLVAYAVTARAAQVDKGLLGTDIAYVDNKKVMASSLTRGGSEEDSNKVAVLNELFTAGTLSDSSPKQKVSIGGTDYFAVVAKMPLTGTKQIPTELAAPSTIAVVLSAFSDEDAGTGAPTWVFVLLVGGGALAIALLGIYLTHRRMIAQVDQIEQGVTDIINGNVDRTFRPVGFELDGLANGLNVMLARLLGRPEPGEEEFDEDGNPIIPGRVEFEETEGQPAVDPDLAALTQESEPDYYKRVYTEYVAARKAAGSPDEVSFENFIAKLKVNEGKLKAQYQCRAVRFRVVTKDGKVTLKPVPIFA
jgi:type II secretory pathway pseudopilin PulG